ncbi:MAG: hypothetical protein KHZ32_07640 [Actinomyces sp.]|nr:hypothetical protein [Actinomyces sp.]
MTASAGHSALFQALYRVDERGRGGARASPILTLSEDFQTTNYEKFNKSTCQFMDSIEIMMHLPPTADS